ncbi:hypothetical protein JVT61DRAFT_11220 [Boletus reticuloceps]|uniref:Peptidase M1 leukotriene A4 hydrolase/aminopeptidase C-terminal domain-containing protein n=1 Tax=Boletus reticuloceps TaxID=495285 RepID=A0A8I2YEY9_9AGAM|nr:hypothetical protein JVT61DRAFT_11220 [Boletus reticuloceps]
MAAQVPDRDPTTQSNYTKIATTNLSLDWTVDFDKRCIYGSATHQVTAKEDVSEVIFDTRVLDIESVEVNGHVVETQVDPEHPVMGTALHVPLPRMRAGETVLTEGKAFPYLFSQCQPIHARSVAPLQVLLSARRVSPPSDGPPHGGKVIGTDAVTYEYRQAEPIPSYLLAIAAGDLRYRPFVVPEGRTWSCGVWTEPKLLEDAYNEFCEDTPRYLAAAEDLAGPYRFGVYDLLVLPHSFPYGGMENPCISFVTPTLITGDRSLTAVVIHELTHSWFGNGVTHAHASHFWLNEGWTTYIERLVQGLVHSSGHRGLSYVIGYKSLMDALEQFQSTPKYQRLVIPFEVGEDPDGAYSRVPYDKGANLLLHIERTLGGIDVILPYVKDYVKTYMGHSITTAQCKDHLYSFFANQEDKIKNLDSIDWNAWFYGEGVTLPVEMEYDLTLVTAAYDLADRWNATRDVDDPDQLEFKPSDIDPLDSNQRVVFLKRLETYLALPTKHVLHLDGLYRFSQTTNSEIRMAFYLVTLKEPTSTVAKLFVQPVLDWVIGKDTGVIQGRMKFCRPLFRDANKVDREKTVAAYESARTLFHPIARKLIEQDLGLSS